MRFWVLLLFGVAYGTSERSFALFCCCFVANGTLNAVLRGFAALWCGQWHSERSFAWF